MDQLEEDIDAAEEAGWNAHQCAYYFKEGMYGDYVNGIDLNTVYDRFDTDPGTGCAVWYNAEGTVAWDEYYEELVAAEEALEDAALALAAGIEPNMGTGRVTSGKQGFMANTLETASIIGCAIATIGILLIGLNYHITKNRVDPFEEEEDAYERI